MNRRGSIDRVDRQGLMDDRQGLIDVTVVDTVTLVWPGGGGCPRGQLSDTEGGEGVPGHDPLAACHRLVDVRCPALFLLLYYSPA